MQNKCSVIIIYIIRVLYTKQNNLADNNDVQSFAILKKMSNLLQYF